MGLLANIKNNVNAAIRQKVLLHSISQSDVADNFDAVVNEVAARGCIQVANTTALATTSSTDTKMTFVTGVGFFMDTATGPANGASIFAGVSGRFWKLYDPTSNLRVSVPDPTFDNTEFTI